jgi:hypothetical protein
MTGKMPMIHDVPTTFSAQVALEEQDVHPGEQCVLLGGGHVAVVGTDPELGTLVRYSEFRDQVRACAREAWCSVIRRLSMHLLRDTQG